MRKHLTLALFPHRRIPLMTLAIILIAFTTCSINLYRDHSRRFAFTRRPDGWTYQQVYIGRQGDPEVLPLTADQTFAYYNPVWSPDGSRIAFTVVDTASLPPNYEVYLMNGDGGCTINISQNSIDNDSALSWSPNGRKIAWISGPTGGPLHLIISNPDGSDPQNLVPSMNIYGTTVTKWSQPSWSPDGRMIALSANLPAIPPDPAATGEIVIIDVNARNYRRLTKNTVLDLFPVWSPDGRRIVYQRDSAPSQIVSCNSDGNGEIVLINNGGINQFPTWSPDGRKIVFYSDDGNPPGDPTLRSVQRDGINEEIELCDQTIDFNGPPVISPDGRTTLCATSNSPFLIYSVRTDGSGYEIIMTHTSVMSSPVWAPR